MELGAYGAKNARRSSVGSIIAAITGGAITTFLPSTVTRHYRWSYLSADAPDSTSLPVRPVVPLIVPLGDFPAPAFRDQQNLGVPLNEVYDCGCTSAKPPAGVSLSDFGAYPIRLQAEPASSSRRYNRALIGMQGYEASGGVFYRLSRSDKIGVRYEFHSLRVFQGSMAVPTFTWSQICTTNGD